MERKPLSFYIGASQQDKLIVEKNNDAVDFIKNDLVVIFMHAYKLHREKIEESNIPLKFLVGKMIDDVFVLVSKGTIPAPNVLKHYTRLLKTATTS